MTESSDYFNRPDLNDDSADEKLSNLIFELINNEEGQSSLNDDSIDKKLNYEMKQESGHDSMEVDGDNEHSIPISKQLVKPDVGGAIGLFDGEDASVNSLIEFSSGSKSINIINGDYKYQYKAKFLYSLSFENDYFIDLYRHLYDNICTFIESNENLFKVILNTVRIIDEEISFVKKKEREMRLISNGDINSPFNYCKDVKDFDINIGEYQNDLKNIRKQMMRFCYSRNCIDKFFYITIPSWFEKISNLFKKNSK